MDILSCDDQDPDYFMIFRHDISSQNVFEKNARINTVKKISKVIEDEFLNEISNKKTEIYKIYKNLDKACKMLHYLRYAIVTDFYSQENICSNDVQTLKQTRVHCTVSPFRSKKISLSGIGYKNNCFEELDGDIKRKRKNNNEHNNKHLSNKYVENIIKSTSLSNICKIKKRIIVGNISKWISPDFRHGNASHKWTIYIRDIQKSDIGQFISKVRFFLHSSYKPNDVVELTSAPFYLSRHGWGEFPIRVQLHFANGLNKPVDIIHYLKLDRTYTGLQTIGSETIVDLWINMKDTFTIPNSKESTNQNTILIDNKSKKSNLPENNYFLNDHNYMNINLKFNRENSYYLQKSQELNNTQLYVPQNKVTASKKNLSFNFKVKDNKTCIKNENFKILSKTKQLLIKKLSLFEHKVKESSNEHKLKYDCNVKSLQNNFSEIINIINSKKIYFKYSDYIYNEENFKTLINLIECTKPNTLFNILKLILRNIPLITEKSSESYYKMVYPYTCESYQQFFNFSKGKQRSLERYRAIGVLNIIRCTKYYNNICNINEIITWARRFYYTPFFNLKNIHKKNKSNKLIGIKNENITYKYTSTISDTLTSWLLDCQTIDLNLKDFNSENNEEIDILNIPLHIPDSLSMYHSNLKGKNNTEVLIEYPKTDHVLNEFVCKSLQEVGIKLVNEEIIPGVLHHTTNVLITKAIEYFVDDLLRIAFSCSLDKSKNESIFIEVDDVRMALLKKEEFEIFTNAGLGSEG